MGGYGLSLSDNKHDGTYVYDVLGTDFKLQVFLPDLLKYFETFSDNGVEINEENGEFYLANI